MMNDFGLTLSAVTFSTLIKAFNKAGKLRQCLEASQGSFESQKGAAFKGLAIAQPKSVGLRS